MKPRTAFQLATILVFLPLYVAVHFLAGALVLRNPPGADLQALSWSWITILLFWVVVRGLYLSGMAELAGIVHLNVPRWLMVQEVCAALGFLGGVSWNGPTLAFLTYPQVALYLSGVILLSNIVWLSMRPKFWQPTLEAKVHFLASRDTNDWNARRCLFAGAALLALLLLLASRLDSAPNTEEVNGVSESNLLLRGVLLGAAFALLQPHPQRILASVSIGFCLFTVGLLIQWLWPAAMWPVLLAGFGAGWPLVSLEIALLNTLMPRQRFSAMMLATLPSLALAGLLAWLLPIAMPPGRISAWLLIPAIAGTLVFGRLFIREFFELVVELALLPMYRIRVSGPGLDQVPLRGPAIVLANHSSWLDPLWIAKALPCRLTPLMVSRFFDLPFIRWVVGPVAHCIRVPDARFRREAPEIEEAIRRLDRGEIVLIFPEGWLRRKEESLLRRFGQGIYQMLREKPNTPVIACWIEGGWGSYMSFFNGPPMKNKKLDCRRLIGIGVSKPQILGLDLLLDPVKTRKHLMQACLNAREYLGLPVPEVSSFAENGDEEKPE
ncbi:MAG TPA: lysophospholipid acyltransferase family protein [Gemmataceae bacterium]|nr:lysophospholipid acyltransferase family protein [Gemmataceae bacterium]